MPISNKAVAGLTGLATTLGVGIPLGKQAIDAKNKYDDMKTELLPATLGAGAMAAAVGREHAKTQQREEMDRYLQSIMQTKYSSALTKALLMAGVATPIIGAGAYAKSKIDDANSKMNMASVAAPLLAAPLGYYLGQKSVGNQVKLSALKDLIKLALLDDIMEQLDGNN
jgi:hypothetical protein